MPTARPRRPAPTSRTSWIRSAATGARGIPPEEVARANRINTDLQKTQRLLGASFVSRTALDPERFGTREPLVALRAVLANPLTTELDLDAVLDEQARLGEQL